MLSKNVLPFRALRKWRTSCARSTCATSNTSERNSKDPLLVHIQPFKSSGTNKVTVVGVGGQVGLACAISILMQKVTNSVCLLDLAKDKVTGEMLDLQHGSAYLENATITADSDFSISRGSSVCIVAAGVRSLGDSRLNLVELNAEVVTQIIPQLVKHSPDAVLLVVCNPVDIMTYVAWKVSGFPKHRVIGSGTSLDSARFRFLLAQRVGIGVCDCHGWIIGEHGDSSVAVWSDVNFAGVRLHELNPNAGLPEDPENWTEIHKEVIDGALRVRALKGHTNWAIGLSVSSITRSILRNAGSVEAISVHAKGLHGITEDVFLSLPAVLGAGGVRDIVKLRLTDVELAELQKSARILAKVQASISTN